MLRVHGDTHAYPIGISVGPKHTLLTSWFSNTVEKVDRKTGKLVATLGDFAAPVDALETADGTIYVAELASANLVKVSPDGKTRSTVVKELRGPVALAQGPGNLIYVTEIAAGAVTQIDVVTGRAQGRGRRARRSRRHRCRTRRPALCRRGRPEARGRHRSRDRRPRR